MSRVTYLRRRYNYCTLRYLYLRGVIHVYLASCELINENYRCLCEYVVQQGLGLNMQNVEILFRKFLEAIIKNIRTVLSPGAHLNPRRAQRAGGGAGRLLGQVISLIYRIKTCSNKFIVNLKPKFCALLPCSDVHYEKLFCWPLINRISFWRHLFPKRQWRTVNVIYMDTKILLNELKKCSLENILIWRLNAKLSSISAVAAT